MRNIAAFNFSQIAFSKHRSAASPTRKIATALVWTCDTNVPGKNSQKTVQHRLVEGLEAVPELDGEIT